MDELPHEDEVENIIKEAVHTELESLEREPARETWQQVSRKLDQPGDAGAGNGRCCGARIGWIRSIGIAAAVVLFVGAGIWASRAINDSSRYDLAGRSDFSAEKYQSSCPETAEEAEEKGDFSPGNNDEETDFLPEKPLEEYGYGRAPDRTRDSGEMHRFIPPRTLGQFKLADATRPESGATPARYLYTDGERELLLLVADPRMLSGKEPIHGENDEYITPDFLEELHRVPAITSDSLGKPVMAWTEKDGRIYILWPQDDDIASEELRKLYRRISLPDSRGGNP